jgi:hypothetical protein
MPMDQEARLRSASGSVTLAEAEAEGRRRFGAACGQVRIEEAF